MERIMSMIMRRLMNKGINSGIRAASQRGQKREDMTPEQRQITKNSQKRTKNVAQAMRLMRRVTKL